MHVSVKKCVQSISIEVRDAPSLVAHVVKSLITEKLEANIRGRLCDLPIPILLEAYEALTRSAGEAASTAGHSESSGDATATGRRKQRKHKH